MVSNSTNPDFYSCVELQTTSDLGFNAASRLMQNLEIDINEIGGLLFGSRTPDYRSPVTAAVLQSRLGLGIDCICYDINVGSNGFIQLIQIGGALLRSINKKYLLLIVGDTPSKLRLNNKEVFFEISDATTAIVLTKSSDNYTVKFLNISIGNLYSAEILRHGGFRDFKSHNHFDATIIDNFILSKNSFLINQLAHLHRDEINQFFIDIDEVLYHSDIQSVFGLDDPYFTQKTIYSNASELPILFESIKETKPKPSCTGFCTIGEGISICGMILDHIPITFSTEFANDYYSEYRVDHEM